MKDSMRLLPGIIYAAQFLVTTIDQPTMARDLILESGYSESELLAEQKVSGHESRKMNAFIREAFAHKESERTYWVNYKARKAEQAQPVSDVPDFVQDNINFRFGQ